MSKCKATNTQEQHVSENVAKKEDCGRKLNNRTRNTAELETCGCQRTYIK